MNCQQRDNETKQEKLEKYLKIKKMWNLVETLGAKPQKRLILNSVEEEEN